jgi:spore photoproduct lyase
MSEQCPADSQRRPRKSRFVDIFRTTPAKTVCPNFFVLAHANGCGFAPKCEYCYLKSSFWYLKDDQVFTNVDDMLAEMRRWIRRDDLESYVLNTGNLSDSLAFEPARPAVARMIELFRAEAEAAGRPHALLLVTKGGVAECETLFAAAPCRNVIVSFSVNNADAARKHESGAASVDDRFEAARRLKSLGWRVRIRIDPMIHPYDYSEVVETTRLLAPERVTLGTLRAEPSLLKRVNHGMFDSLERPADPKALSRYPLRQRLAAYRPAVERLRDVCDVALCEETEDVWLALGLDVDRKACNCGS